MDGPSVLVPIAFFVLIAIVVVGPRYLKSQEQARFTEALKIAFERGQAVPPEVIDYLSASRSASPPPISTDRAHQDMRIGVIWLAIGLGLFAVAGMFYAMLYNVGGAVETGFSIAAGGCIPFFVGLAFLLLSALGRRHAPSGERSGT